MKTVISSMLMVVAINLNAQVIDDFDSGNLNSRSISTSTNTFFQKGPSIIEGIRKIEYELAENPYETNPQMIISRGVLASSVGYMTNAKFTLSYGYAEKELRPLNLNLTGKRYLKIEIPANSSQSSLYVTLFTNNDRGTYSNHVSKSEGKMVFEMPLNKIKKIGANFTLADVDHIKISFNSRNQNGSNLAISKIWFE